MQQMKTNNQKQIQQMWMTKIDFHPYMVQIVVDSETTILNTSWGILPFVFVLPEGAPLQYTVALQGLHGIF